MAPPKKLLWPDIYIFLAIFLFLCGLGQTVSSGFVIYYSGHYFFGGVYASAALFLMGVRCFQAKTRGWYIFDSVLLAMTVILSLVAVVTVGYVYRLMNEFAACSSYSNSLSTSCGGGPSNFNCYGDSDYFISSEICAADYAINNGKDENECVCVKDDQDDNTCYTFASIPSCDNFINKLPTTMAVCLVFTVAGVFFSVSLLVLVVLSLCCRKTLGVNDDEEELTDPLLTEYPTVVAASAPLYTNDGPPPNYRFNNSNSNY